MFNVHATKKLYAKLTLDDHGLLNGRELTEPYSESGLIGDWTAHIMTIERRQCLLFVHHQTRFPVFIPAVRKPNFKNLNAMFEDVFLNTLLKLGLSQEPFELAGNSLRPMHVDSNTDRSVLGTINQFKRVLEWICRDYDLDETTGYSISRTLSHHLCSTQGNRDYIVPAVEMAKLLGESEEGAARIGSDRLGATISEKFDDVHLVVLGEYLERYSNDQGVRNFPELHGFLTGVLLCQRAILPSEWMPAVWGGEEFSPAFEDIEQATAFQTALMSFYNDVVDELMMVENFEPMFAEYEDRPGREYSTPWCYGFIQGFMLDDTQDLSSEDAQMAMAIISMPFDPTFTQDFEADGDVIEAHCEQVRVALLALHHTTRGTGRGQDPAFAASPFSNDPNATNRFPANVVPFKREAKVGRNEPCPCGSGKKHKKCCLLIT